MKWIMLTQSLLLLIVGILLLNFRTITKAGAIVFEVCIIISTILAITMFILQVKKELKEKKKENDKKQEKE